MNTILEIIRKHLKENKFDGLYNSFNNCCCTLDNLGGCNAIITSCKPGNKLDCKTQCENEIFNRDHCNLDYFCIGEKSIKDNKKWFGKGCEYLSAQWEDTDMEDHKEYEPVLTYCNHPGNPSESEGNCYITFCPLKKEK